MKFWVIIVAIGGIFICSANFLTSKTTSHQPLTFAHSIPENAADKSTMQLLKKSKSNKLPRWHRVIPGMFR